MKKWVVSELDRAKAKQLMEEFGLPAFSAMLLTIRGITDRESIESFFSQEITLDDPMLIRDMDKAVKRIRKAVSMNERICVYGDYDCDGVTSTAILFSYFESVFADVIFYIPDRNAEGYGMNKSAVEILKEKGVKLIITVDNGISALDEIEYATGLGMDVVVTDHHKPLEILPRAAAVVNPHRSDESYEFRDYSGAGLALKLICALECDDHAALENYSDLAALGTVADIVPLTGENRSIVKSGINNIKNTERIGLAKLIEASQTEKISAGTIGFCLAPRINASGRLGTPYDALELFLTEDEEAAEEKAELLSKLNTKRQSIESEISYEIIKMLADDPMLRNDRVIVVSAAGWNPGVIGIVSSRITERYGKPSVIISEDGEVCKASGRSVAGFSLVDALFECSGMLEKYGGHPMAVGFSIKKEKIPDFRRAINEVANRNEYMPALTINLDCNLRPEIIELDMLRQLQSFEPFGCGNPRPVFGLKELQLDRITPVGGGKHLKLSVSKGNTHLNMMKFSTTPEEFPYREGDMLDFAVSLESNVFQGREGISFNIRDIRFSGFDADEIIKELQDYELYRSGVVHGRIKDRCPGRSDFAAVYRYLRDSRRKLFTIEELTYRLKNEKIGTFRIMMVLEILSEVELIRFSRDADKLKIEMTPTKARVDLDISRIYQKMKEDVVNAGKD